MEESNEFKQILTEKERNAKIKKNIQGIRKNLSSVDTDTLKLNEHLIIEAAQYAMMLDEINMIISRDGFVDFYKNGENQFGTKKSVAAELKPKYTQIYQSLIKQLSDLLPDDGDNALADEMINFINKRPE